jgi:hypothetical protein
MPVELPMFEEGQGLMLCICGEFDPTASAPAAQKTQIIEYDTPHGAAFARAGIRGKEERTLIIECARSIWFPKDQLPKVTTKKKEDIDRIIESAYGLRLKANVCVSFRVPLAELPESGLIRSLLFESKSASASIRMTGASFTLTGAPFSLLRWRSVSTKDNVTMVYIDTKGKREIQVSDTCLTELWRLLYAEFAVWVLGGREADTRRQLK